MGLVWTLKQIMDLQLLHQVDTDVDPNYMVLSTHSIQSDLLKASSAPLENDLLTSGISCLVNTAEGMS